MCAACKRPIGERGGVPFCQREGQVYHVACHKETFHPKCQVCADWLPEVSVRWHVYMTERHGAEEAEQPP